MGTLFRSPAPALAPFVDALWYVAERLPPERERVLPTGSMQLVVNLADDVVRWYDGDRLDAAHTIHGAGLCGAVTHAVGIDTADRAIGAGVAFRPGGARAFFSPPASALVDPVIALDALWGADGASLRERLLEQRTPQDVLDTLETVLLERMVAPGVPERSMSRAIIALEHGVSVAQAADDLGMATSTLHRRFRTSVGLAPKAFGRVRRLQRVLGDVDTGDVDTDDVDTGDVDARPVDWAELAVRHGYFDQAHLINEFRGLTGLTPGRYRPRSAGERNHVPLLPA